MEKIIIYQVLVRTATNPQENLVPNGTLEQNSCGKMQDYSTQVLQQIRSLGATHIWYTGLLEHATQTDYTAQGIPMDNPAIVKGIAGSPYAIKDYYDIDPDLAKNVKLRRREFTTLLNRTHKAGLKFILDFVPNHVARQYHSDSKPKKVQDIGAQDDVTQAFSNQNNFYYIPQEPLHTQYFDRLRQGESPYVEYPAKATGNDRFDAYPNENDWYETVKLNYGIDYVNGHREHFDPIPDTWHKMLDILLFWAGKGVDGFRCDMAEMVPCAFWQWALAQVKEQYPEVIFIAEIYNPQAYRDYIYRGGFDYLYDKVGMYDALRNVITGATPAAALTSVWQSVDDISEHMLGFLENHDEQRIASDFFAQDARKALPALVVGACLNKAPYMIYAGQELGERGMEAEGFSGCDGRSTIFDYWHVDTLRRWLYAPDTLTQDELYLQSFYKQVLHICRTEPAIVEGQFFDLMYANYDAPMRFDANRQFAFLRKSSHSVCCIVANFADFEVAAGVKIPEHAFDYLQLRRGVYSAIDLLSGDTYTIELQSECIVNVRVPAHGAAILKISF